MPMKDKLLERVALTSTGCQEYIGAKDYSGYGRIWNGENRTAHTVAYEEFIGPIPEGMHILHTCDNPPCINPEHLWLGTHDDNMADKGHKKRYPPKNPFNGKFMEKA